MPAQGSDAAAEIQARGHEIWLAIRSYCEHHFGQQIELDPSASGDQPYARALARTGARRATWWSDGDAALVLTVHGDPVPAPVKAMALHVVPVGWMSPARPSKKVPPLDLTWSWTDVLSLS